MSFQCAVYCTTVIILNIKISFLYITSSWISNNQRKAFWVPSSHWEAMVFLVWNQTSRFDISKMDEHFSNDPTREFKNIVGLVSTQYTEPLSLPTAAFYHRWKRQMPPTWSASNVKIHRCSSQVNALLIIMWNDSLMFFIHIQISCTSTLVPARFPLFLEGRESMGLSAPSCPSDNDSSMVFIHIQIRCTSTLVPAGFSRYLEDWKSLGCGAPSYPS